MKRIIKILIILIITVAAIVIYLSIYGIKTCLLYTSDAADE